LCTNQAHMTMIVSVESVPALARILAAPSSTIREKRAACKTLKSLAFDVDLSAFHEAKDSVLPALMQTLRLPCTDPAAQAAADALEGLSTDVDFHESMRPAIALLSHLLSVQHSPAMVHSAACTLANLANVENQPRGGLTDEQLASDLLSSGGIDGLLALLPARSEGAQEPLLKSSNRTTEQAVCATLAVVAVHPEVGDAIRDKGDITEQLVALLRDGPRSTMARHAAAILARMAHSDPSHTEAVLAGGAIAPLVELCEDAVRAAGELRWREDWCEDLCQAAQHGAAALWILAEGSKGQGQITAHPSALNALASLIGGRMGAKAEGNAAGALLALGRRVGDPVSVVAVIGY